MARSPIRGMVVLLCLLVIGTAALGPPGRLAAAPEPQASPVETRLVQVQTEDGVRLDGALFTPDAPQRRAIGVLVLHGIGSNFYGDVQVFLGKGLAAAGYQTLAINLRSHDQHYANSLFPDTAKDVRAAIGFLIAQGAQRVYLVGHSLGTIAAAYYAGSADDPRVAALGLYAPLDSLPYIQREYQQGRRTTTPSWRAPASWPTAAKARRSCLCRRASAATCAA